MSSYFYLTKPFLCKNQKPGLSRNQQRYTLQLHARRWRDHMPSLISFGLYKKDLKQILH